MFAINKQTDYALIMIYHLKNQEDFVPLSYLVQQTKMPQRFLARIAAELVRHKILFSKEGKTGGYKLAKKPEKIPLYDFLTIFEESLQLISCYDSKTECDCVLACRHREFFGNKLTNLLIDQLKNWTLADTFAE